MKKGTLDILNFKAGSAQVQRIMKGTELIWSQTPCVQIEDFSWVGNYVCDTEHFDMGIGPFSDNFYSLVPDNYSTTENIGLVHLDVYVREITTNTLEYIAFGSLPDVNKQYTVEVRDGNFRAQVSNGGNIYSTPVVADTYYHVIFDFGAKILYINGRSAGSINMSDSSTYNAVFGSSSSNTWEFASGSINKPVVSNVGNLSLADIDAIYVEAVNARKINDQLVNIIDDDTHTLGSPIFRIKEDGSAAYIVTAGSTAVFKRHPLTIPFQITSAAAVSNSYTATTSTQVVYSNRASASISHDAEKISYGWNKAIQRVDFVNDKLGSIIASDSQGMATTTGYYPSTTALLNNSAGDVASILYKYKYWTYIGDTHDITNYPFIINAVSSPFPISGSVNTPGSADMSSDGKRFFTLSDGDVKMYNLAVPFDLTSGDSGTVLLTGQGIYTTLFVKVGFNDEFYISRNTTLVRHKIKVVEKVGVNMFFAFHNYTYVEAYDDPKQVPSYGAESKLATWYRYTQGPNNIPEPETAKITLARAGVIDYKTHHFNWNPDRASVILRLFDSANNYLGRIENSKVVDTWSNTSTTASFMRFYNAAGTLIQEYNGSHFAGSNYGNGGIERIIDLTNTSKISLWSPQTTAYSTHFNRNDIVTTVSHALSTVRKISIQIVDIQSNYSGNNGTAYILIGDPGTVWNNQYFWFTDPKFYVLRDDNVGWTDNTFFYWDGVQVAISDSGTYGTTVSPGDGYEYTIGKLRRTSFGPPGGSTIDYYSIGRVAVAPST